MLRHKSLLRNLPPVILTILLMAVYLASMAPGLTWANYGADGGDLITAAATGGVAHPTGYPLYLIFARLFQLLPIGSLAFRTNLMSALATTFAAVLVYDLVTQSPASTNAPQIWLAGLTSGIAFWTCASDLVTGSYYRSLCVALNVVGASAIFICSCFVSPFHAETQGLFCWGSYLAWQWGTMLPLFFLLPVIFLTTIHHKPTSTDENTGSMAGTWMAVPYYVK